MADWDDDGGNVKSGGGFSVSIVHGKLDRVPLSVCTTCTLL